MTFVTQHVHACNIAQHTGEPACLSSSCQLAPAAYGVSTPLPPQPRTHSSSRQSNPLGDAMIAAQAEVEQQNGGTQTEIVPSAFSLGAASPLV